MATNLEIKARCRDLERARRVVASLATEHAGLDDQLDTYFATVDGRLKLRESSLSGAQLVSYRRPDLGGPKRSDYVVLPVDDPALLKSLLREQLGVHAVVHKSRDIWLYQNVRIHLDRVDALGDFVELEAVFDGSGPAERAQREPLSFLCAKLEIRPSELIPTSYEAMVRREADGAGGVAE